MTTRKLTTICLTVALGAALALGLTPPQYLGQTGTSTPPDVTVAPCAMFARHAQIPAYTRLDECVADDGAMVQR